MLPEFYSVKEIASFSTSSIDDVLRVAVSNKLIGHKKNNDIFIHRDNIKALLAELHKDVSRAFYDVATSASLNSPFPWANVLKSVYEEYTACPASLSPQQGELLRSLILNIQPKRSLEIGCFIGASTLWICSALKYLNNDPILHTIDLFGDKLPFGRYKYLFHPDALGYIRDCLKRAQVDHCNVQHVGNSHILGKRYNEIIGEKLDFIFIDGDHTIEGCLQDYLLYEPHLNIGGYLMFHDIFPDKCGWDGPRFVLDNHVKKSKKFELIDINTAPLDYGIALARKLA